MANNFDDDLIFELDADDEIDVNKNTVSNYPSIDVSSRSPYKTKRTIDLSSRSAPNRNFLKDIRDFKKYHQLRPLSKRSESMESLSEFDHNSDHVATSFYKKPSHQHKKYVTIRTLSFNHYLSTDTPLIRLGNKHAPMKLFLSVCIHGDEPCGMIGFNQLLSEGFFESLSPNLMLTVLVGNPKGVEEGKRFVGANLNRMIREDLFKENVYESERARVVANEIDRCDVMLDLHSCSADAPAHALPMDDPKSVEFASKMPVAFVIKHLAHTTPGKATTLDWAQKKKKIGICVECGRHDAPQTIESAKKCIKTFIEIFSGKPISSTYPQPILLNSTENETVRKGFHFVRKVKAFEKVPFGEVIARDDHVGPIRSKYSQGTFIVMPTANPVMGEEAWFYAKQSYSFSD